MTLLHYNLLTQILYIKKSLYIYDNYITFSYKALFLISLASQGIIPVTYYDKTISLTADMFVSLYYNNYLIISLLKEKLQYDKYLKRNPHLKNLPAVLDDFNLKNKII